MYISTYIYMYIYIYIYYNMDPITWGSILGVPYSEELIQKWNGTSARFRALGLWVYANSHSGGLGFGFRVWGLGFRV